MNCVLAREVESKPGAHGCTPLVQSVCRSAHKQYYFLLSFSLLLVFYLSGISSYLPHPWPEFSPAHHPFSSGGCSTDLLVRIDWPSAVGPFRLDVASRSAPLPIVWIDWVFLPDEKNLVVENAQVVTTATNCAQAREVESNRWHAAAPFSADRVP